MSEDQVIIEEEKKPRRSKSLPIFITLFILSMLLNAFLFYKYAMTGEKLKKEHEKLEIAYAAANLDIDSLKRELDMVNAQLEAKMNELFAKDDMETGLLAELNQQKNSLASARRRIQRLLDSGASEGGGMASDGGPANLAQAKMLIQQLEQTNQQKLSEIATAQSQYEEAKKTASQFEKKVVLYKYVNDSLVAVTTDLQEQLDEASALRIAGLAVNPIREKKGVQQIMEKASKTERLKITFSTLGSELTKVEKKEVILRIIGPEGEVLTESNKSKLQDKSTLFSLKEYINYDGTEKGITYYYDQEADYKKGKYRVEFLHKGNLLDRKTFSLR